CPTMAKTYRPGEKGSWVWIARTLEPEKSSTGRISSTNSRPSGSVKVTRTVELSGTSGGSATSWTVLVDGPTVMLGKVSGKALRDIPRSVIISTTPIVNGACGCFCPTPPDGV